MMINHLIVTFICIGTCMSLDSPIRIFTNGHAGYQFFESLPKVRKSPNHIEDTIVADSTHHNALANVLIERQKPFIRNETVTMAPIKKLVVEQPTSTTTTTANHYKSLIKMRPNTVLKAHIDESIKNGSNRRKSSNSKGYVRRFRSPDRSLGLARIRKSSSQRFSSNQFGMHMKSQQFTTTPKPIYKNKDDLFRRKPSDTFMQLNRNYGKVTTTTTTSKSIERSLKEKRQLRMSSIYARKKN